MTDISITYLLRPCAVFKLHRGCLAKFRWHIAKGRHLFPFRTEQLSLSAPMVLGGQPPGRVGRRRFFFDYEPPRWGGSRRFRAPRSGPRSRDRRPAAAKSSRVGRCAAGLAARRSSPSGLQPVLAECGEVDQEIDGVGQPFRERLLVIEHGFVRYGGPRTATRCCKGPCIVGPDLALQRRSRRSATGCQ